MNKAKDAKKPELMTIKPQASHEAIKRNLTAYLARQGIDIKKLCEAKMRNDDNFFWFIVDPDRCLSIEGYVPPIFEKLHIKY